MPETSDKNQFNNCKKKKIPGRRRSFKEIEYVDATISTEGETKD